MDLIKVAPANPHRTFRAGFLRLLNDLAAPRVAFWTADARGLPNPYRAGTDWYHAFERAKADWMDLCDSF